MTGRFRGLLNKSNDKSKHFFTMFTVFIVLQFLHHIGRGKRFKLSGFYRLLQFQRIPLAFRRIIGKGD
jgi:hypothetical protein